MAVGKSTRPELGFGSIFRGMLTPLFDGNSSKLFLFDALALITVINTLVSEAFDEISLLQCKCLLQRSLFGKSSWGLPVGRMVVHGRIVKHGGSVVLARVRLPVPR